MSLFRGVIAVCICVCAMSPALLFAQESEDSQETLFSGDVEHGGYGVVSLKVSPILDNAQLLTGGYGGWFINHTLMIGGGGYGLTSRMSLPDAPKSEQGRAPLLSMGYGGLMVEYTHNSHKLLHFTGSLLLGAGGAGYSWNYSASDTVDVVDNLDADAFFVGEVSANIELNISSFARVAMGGSYRFVSGVEMAGLTSKNLSGPSGNINFKFGKF